MSPTRRDRFDVAVIAAGALLSGALGVGGALLLSSASSTRGLGPTAASLNDAFSLLFGALIGFAVACACVAFSARRGPRLLTGLAAGILGYALIPAPTLIATRPSDVSLADGIITAVFAGALVVPAMLLGAAVGTVIGGYRRTPPAQTSTST